MTPQGASAPGERAVEAIRCALLDWYARHRRELPWREDPAPYRVLLSEIMLQQTTVEAVRPRFEEFVARFPSLSALAEASEEEVLAAWSGLGYYERARNLRRAAILLVRENGGAVPDSAEALARLPGIGRYTAGAIASIAYGRREPILDGNVARLFARLFLVDGDPRAAATRARLWDLAALLVPAADPSAFNQALMELGALVCRPREPDCASCPLEAQCGARRTRAVALYPRRVGRKPAAGVLVAAAIARDRRGRLLLTRRPQGGALRGMWELPSVEVRPAAGADEIASRIREETGLSFAIGPLTATARHSVMNRRIVLRAYRATLRGGGAAPPRTRGPKSGASAGARRDAPRRAGATRETAWVDAESIGRYPHSSLLEKVLARLSREPDAALKRPSRSRAASP